MITMIETATNRHSAVLDAAGFPVGTVCSPDKLPKRFTPRTADEKEISTVVLNGVTHVMITDREIICHRCNKVNHRGR